MRNNISGLKVSENDTIHIVSAGPSCRHFNWENIRGEDIMSINGSLFYLPLPISYHVYNEPLITQLENYDKMTKYTDTIKFTTFKKDMWYTVNKYNDNNLAFQLAINLSIDLGYKHLKLYGYDFSCPDGFVHWWDDMPMKYGINLEKKRKILLKQTKLFKKLLNDIKDKVECTII